MFVKKIHAFLKAIQVFFKTQTLIYHKDQLLEPNKN